VFPGVPFSKTAPNGIVPTPETVVFDASVHLQLGSPKFVKMLTAADTIPSTACTGTASDHSGVDTMSTHITSTDRVRFPVPLSTVENEQRYKHRDGASAGAGTGASACAVCDVTGLPVPFTGYQHIFHTSCTDDTYTNTSTH